MSVLFSIAIAQHRTPVSLNVTTFKFLTVTPEAVLASDLKQTGGDMTVYNSSASAAFASIDVKSPQVIKFLLTFANQFRNSTRLSDETLCE